MSKKKTTPSDIKTDKGKTEIKIAQIGLISAVIVAVIGVIGTIFNSYFASQAAQVPIVFPIQATQTAEARLLLTVVMPSSTSPIHATPTSGLATAITSTPQQQLTSSLPLSTSTTLGVLSIKVLEGCGINDFDIKNGGLIIGSSKSNQKEYLLEGTYDIVLKSDFGKDLTRTGISIQKGKETIANFSNEMGALLLNSYPQLKMFLPYTAYSSDGGSRGYLYSNSYFCGSPEKYTINLSPTFPNYSGYGSSFFTIGLFHLSDIQFDVEVKAGETTVVEPDVWSKQMGAIGFDAKDPTALTVQIYELRGGLQTKIDNEFTLSSTEQYWMLTGTYNIVITKPYSGLVFENIEIKPGEKIVLPLPSP